MLKIILSLLSLAIILHSSTQYVSAQEHDPLAGSPYHKCMSAKNNTRGFTDLIDTTYNAAVDTIPDSLLTTPLKNALKIDTDKEANKSDLWDKILSYAIDKVDTAPLGLVPDRTIQYYIGCDPGSQCAMAYDLTEYGITGDDICVPTQEWGQYIVGKQREIGADQPDYYDRVLRSYPKSTTLGFMCMRNTPYAKDLIYALINQSTDWKPWDYIDITRSQVLWENFASGRPVKVRVNGFDREMKNIDLLADRDVQDQLTSILRVQGAEKVGQTSVTQRTISSLSSCLKCSNEGKLSTAFGCVETTDLQGFITQTVYGLGLGLAGAYCLIMMIVSAVRIQTSAGDSEAISQARDTIRKCITGLLIIIFAVFAIRFIGVDLLRLPGLG